MHVSDSSRYSDQINLSIWINIKKMPTLCEKTSPTCQESHSTT